MTEGNPGKYSIRVKRPLGLVPGSSHYYQLIYGRLVRIIYYSASRFFLFGFEIYCTYFFNFKLQLTIITTVFLSGGDEAEA